MTHNRDLMAEARANLRGHWKPAVLIGLLYIVLIGAIGFVPVLGPIANLLIDGAILVGLYRFFLHLSRNEEVRVCQLFDGFSGFVPALVAYLLRGIFIILWALLLIVPGIMAAYSYALTFWILADNPTVDGMEAIGRSKRLMKGRRWKLFCLQCRFIGWALLCLLTAGIGFFWLVPYMTASTAAFYKDVLRTAEPPAAAPPAGQPVSP